METKHTKGKWIVVDSGGKVISRTSEENYADICTLADRPLAISPEVEANAKLIAAAPDLLEVLDVIVHFYDDQIKPSIIYAAQNAIKKATL